MADQVNPTMGERTPVVSARWHHGRVRRCPAGRDEGSVLPLLAALMGFVVLVGIGLVALSAQAGRKAHAQAAADAVALAFAGGGGDAAMQVAEANDVRIVSIVELGDEVLVDLPAGGRGPVAVVVDYRGVTARAGAARFPAPSAGTPTRSPADPVDSPLVGPVVELLVGPGP